MSSTSRLRFSGELCYRAPCKSIESGDKKVSTSISGVGESNFIAERAVDIIAKSHSDDCVLSFEAIVTNTITDPLHNFDLNTDSWNIPNNIKLADPLFFKSQRIDVLLGASLFFDLMCIGQIRLANNLPILKKTRLGWVASGGGLHFHKSSSLVAVRSDLEEEEAGLDDLIKQFWEVEACSAPPTQMQEEIDRELHFQQNHIRLDSGEYAVRLPLKQNVQALGDSYLLAKQRFMSLERGLQHKQDVKKQYSSFMKEYAELKHMSPANLEPTTRAFFLPHHCIHKTDSTTTKLRVVLDGSAKSTSGYSLNDVLMVGPTIQPKLFFTLLGFRL
ncbi:PREDICTED: uncharacterized protein LOC108355601 [Rhagoletis zephyria]|uniref:uncharacterized protein LOC108355601 n=1 Tax=Rhagoletis zephyria TaxID=28612 RepID=UPI000811809E|nr:PREDICTED: uncharacterized protein LOC108355601 [Rhagoletis zephyria]